MMPYRLHSWIFILIMAVGVLLPLEGRAAPEVLSLDSRYFSPFPPFASIEQLILEYSGLKQTALRAIQKLLGSKSIWENTLLMTASTLMNVFYDTRSFIIPFHELGHGRILYKAGCQVAFSNSFGPKPEEKISYNAYFPYLGASMISPFSRKATGYSCNPRLKRVVKLVVNSQGVNNNVAVAQAYAASLQKGTGDFTKPLSFQMGSGSVYEVLNYFLALTYPLRYAQSSTSCGEGNDFCNYGANLYLARFDARCLLVLKDVNNSRFESCRGEKFTKTYFCAEDDFIHIQNSKNICLDPDINERLLGSLRQDVLAGTLISLLLSSSSWFYTFQVGHFLWSGEDRVPVLRFYGIRFPDVAFLLTDIGPSYAITSGYSMRLPKNPWLRALSIPLSVEFVPDRTIALGLDADLGLELWGIGHDLGIVTPSWLPWKTGIDFSLRFIVGTNSNEVGEVGEVGVNVLLSMGLELPWFLQVSLGYHRYDPKTLYGRKRTPEVVEEIFWGRLSFDYGKLLRHYRW